MLNKGELRGEREIRGGEEEGGNNDNNKSSIRLILSLYIKKNNIEYILYNLIIIEAEIRIYIFFLM